MQFCVVFCCYWHIFSQRTQPYMYMGQQLLITHNITFIITVTTSRSVKSANYFLVLQACLGHEFSISLSIISVGVVSQTPYSHPQFCRCREVALAVCLNVVCVFGANWKADLFLGRSKIADAYVVLHLVLLFFLPLQRSYHSAWTTETLDFPV